jgi:hypothetical protein
MLMTKAGHSSEGVCVQLIVKAPGGRAPYSPHWPAAVGGWDDFQCRVIMPFACEVWKR